MAGIDQSRLPALVAAAGDRAGIRFLEFFASTLRNPRWFFYFATFAHVPRRRRRAD